MKLEKNMSEQRCVVVVKNMLQQELKSGTVTTRGYCRSNYGRGVIIVKNDVILYKSYK